MPKPLSLIFWLLTAFLCGIIVATITSILICGLVSRHMRIRYPQAFTFSKLHSIRAEAEAFKTKNNRYPDFLDEFLNKDPNQRHYRTNEAGKPVDEWDNAIIYIAHDNNPQILSYGRDGKEGGIGFDRDLSSDNKGLPPASGSELLLYPFARGIIIYCMIAGCLVSIISLLTMRPSQFSSLDDIPWGHISKLSFLSAGSVVVITFFLLTAH